MHEYCLLIHLVFSLGYKMAASFEHLTMKEFQPRVCLGIIYLVFFTENVLNYTYILKIFEKSEEMLEKMRFKKAAHKN